MKTRLTFAAVITYMAIAYIIAASIGCSREACPTYVNHRSATYSPNPKYPHSKTEARHFKRSHYYVVNR